MDFIHAPARHDERPAGDAGMAAPPAAAHPHRRWQQTWWSTRPAPRPNWLQRLDLGIPLPRQLRR